MCTSKAPKVKPIAAAPQVSPVIIDDAAKGANEELRRKRRQAYGRQSTIIAGRNDATGAPPTAPVKVALGS